ncbi:MAG TPA: GntR family transcriptional regulator [Candidatus Acidoferrales bacterium]|nr:GntR family transcriptional regulator [Candidatus Acidoferrales bacterium]
MSVTAPHLPVSSESESQTVRALVEMRELLIRGEFKPGERIREVPLAARLGVSRTPLRLVLERLAHEGLVEARTKGGFVARQFTLQDVLDVIELRGVLEGTAARLAAERLHSTSELEDLFACAEQIGNLLRARRPVVESMTAYAPLNDRFHARMLELARSPILSRSVEQVMALPLAAPSAFAGSQAEAGDWHETMMVANSQHRAIAEAIARREGTRAEAMAREHSRIARAGVVLAMEKSRLGQLPGGSLVSIA